MNGISVKFQSISLSITVVVMAFLVIGELRKFCSIDQGPILHSITPSTLKEFTTTPAQVRTGMTITDFSEFEVEANKFKMTALVWFYFDPSLISLETVGKFSFLRGEIEHKSEPTASLINGKILARYTTRLIFKTNLYYGFFPFEDHTIYLSLVNTAVSPGELLFESFAGDLAIDADVYVSGWQYNDHRVATGYTELKVGSGSIKREFSSPLVVFALDFEHQSMRYIISILLPLIVIFLIDMFSLCFDQKVDRDTLVALSASNMIALTAYRFVLDSLAPKVGYALLADYLFFLFLFTTFLIFLVNHQFPFNMNIKR